MVGQCKNCLFWIRTAEGNDNGNCRKSAPPFPETWDVDWCGEIEVREIEVTPECRIKPPQVGIVMSDVKDQDIRGTELAVIGVPPRLAKESFVWNRPRAVRSSQPEKILRIHRHDIFYQFE